MAAVLFYGFAGLAILFSLMVVLLRNPVTSTLSLVVSFFAVSGIFVLLGAPLIGVLQVLIYAGAILVLFLYVTMLLNLKQTIDLSSAERAWRWGALGGAGLLASALLSVAVPFGMGSVEEVPETFGSVERVGELLLRPWAAGFELVSLVLLAAIVGAVILSSRKGARR